MHLRNMERASTSCPAGSGTSYYICVSNGWKGCCSVDACDYSWCPDPDAPPNPNPNSASANAAAPSSTSSPSTTSNTASPSPTVTVTAVSLPSSSDGPTSTTVIAANFITPTASPTPSAQPSSRSSTAPIIAGTVSGVVALSILSVLLWFCCKRRQQKRDVREIIKYVPASKRALSRSPTPEIKIPKDKDQDRDVFADFGGTKYSPIVEEPSDQAQGRYVTPSPLPRRPVPSRGPVPARVPIPAPPTSLQQVPEVDDMDIESPLDAPIPDIEKDHLALAPPPMVDHPAFNIGTATPLDNFPNPPARKLPLRTSASSQTILSPSQRTTSPQPTPPKRTTSLPLQSISPQPLTSHPAYHVSQLSQHPAFSSPRSSPRAATFPHRTPQVKRQKSSPRAGGCAGPMDIAPIMPALPDSPIEEAHELDAAECSCCNSPMTPIAPLAPRLPTHELEADVPSCYSPTSTRPPTPISKTSPRNSGMRVQTQTQTQIQPQTYNPADYAPFDKKGRVRNNTLASTYSIPIGLGVTSPCSPSPQTQNQPSSAMSPQSPFHLEKRYPHLNHPLPPLPPAAKAMLEMRDGRHMEVLSSSSSQVSTVREREREKERWSGATVLDTEGEMSGNRHVGQMNGEQVTFVQVNAGAEPTEGQRKEKEGERETPTGMTPSDDFKTWETWAQR